MRVLICAVGSRGDVVPFTGVGTALRRAGHTVTVAAHPSYASLVTGAGLRAHPMPGDLGVLLDLPERSTPAYQAGRVPRLTELLHRAARATLEAAADADLLLVNGSAPFGYDIAEAVGIPSAGLYNQPMTPTGAFPPIVLHSARSWGARGNRLLGELGLRSMIPFHRATARLRGELGLAPRSVGATAARQAREGWPILHGYSPAVLPRPADWRPGLEVVGYWWPEPVAWEPPAELVDFLAAGPPPVLVGFGSMAGGHGGRLLPLVVAALRAAGVRGILQAGRAGLGAAGSGAGFGPDVLAIGDVPHEWLLPRVAAVVHHAGAGATGATLRAGVPSVPAPVFADQPLWSKRLVELGCAPEVIPFRKLEEERLAAALRAVLEPRHREAAQAMARVLADEDGTRAVVELVDRLSARAA